MTEVEPDESGFRAAWGGDDDAIAARLLAQAGLPPDAESRIDAEARRLIAAIRGPGRDKFGARFGMGGVEDLLHEFSLSTAEGVALMMLAEALLRIPDETTADRFIEDKIGQGDWAHHALRGGSAIAGASVWALALARRIVTAGEMPAGVLSGVVRRIGAPAVRIAARQAMRIMGSHFVIGETIGDALSRALTGEGRAWRYSFDMLGEGARTSADARRYFNAYAEAIQAVGRASEGTDDARCSLSVKLSALHPRFESASRARVLREGAGALIELAELARENGLALTVDAEEADRLELTLDVLGWALREGGLQASGTLGIAVQAYQKRAPAVIDWLAERAARGRIHVRLVKGAYWDTEIKRAQERGLDDFPVFTRKAMTDLNYMTCAQQLLNLRHRLFPQFATHNALTLASIVERAGGVDGYEFQRLQGMGETLYRALVEKRPQAAVRVYAPVGSHRDLLAYLVRRLLENGANSSFVARVADPSAGVDELLTRPEALLRDGHTRSRRIVNPSRLFMPERLNSRGVEFGHRESLLTLIDEAARAAEANFTATSLIYGRTLGGALETRSSPIDGTAIGKARLASLQDARVAMEIAARNASAWNARSVASRATILRRAANLIEERRGRFIALLQAEGGKTLDDALAEVREAVDFCRYYAAQAGRSFTPLPLPGPAGEENVLLRRGRGVFVCVSPWNFPLAIFLGQVVAALAAGNAVVAKPAEQTPLIAHEAVRLLHEAGVPPGVLNLALGAGDVGAELVAHGACDGVAFTGSTEVARAINRSLADREGPIVPFIAETGGVNAMIVDASALPEQVSDDVIVSAFRSAGQRCSALRLLCVQDDIADDLVHMIAGAASELKIGDPRDPATHIGPVIDADAKRTLDAYVEDMRAQGRILYAGSAPDGLYVAPHIVRLDHPGDLHREVFGPVLHVARWAADGQSLPDLDATLDAIAATEFGLTLGVHSRIGETVRSIGARMSTGNVYVNRSMIGAVVGSQPFGGSGLSGTGPKAGGPDYLTRFSLEQSVSTNTAAAGGNAALLAGEE